ncbi:hypothetical protein ACEWY4_001225 [Coilia grayii]|uniref:Sushi domain-containing protein n=1 Tax=Coilia grayii TaxID=363190 RepID=A0ABD1KYX4_9TELE
MQVTKTFMGSLWIFLLIPADVEGQCTKPTMTENAVIHEDYILTEIFDEKSTIKVKCHPGYEPTSTSPRRLTCENGQWIPRPEKFTCQKKTCGNPGDIENGIYNYLNGNEFGDTIKAVCKTGYYILGSETRVCMANREWDGQPPVCEVVKCGPPPDVPNGQTRLPLEEEYDYGQVVQYVCADGYTLLGGTVHCLQNGSWSSTLRCIVVDCKRPDIANARRIEGGSGPYRYRDTLRYECNVGYRMTNNTDRTVCLEMGWSPTLVCEEVKCPSLKSTNVIITEGGVGPYRHGSVVRYQCQTGHALVGDSQLKCGLDGQWSSDPVCLKVTECRQLSHTNASIIKGGDGPYKVNDVLEYKCPAENKMIGNPELKCQSDGRWSSDPPYCEGNSSGWETTLGVCATVFCGGVVGGGAGAYWWNKKNSRKTASAVEGEDINLNSDRDPECVIQSSGTQTQTA